MVGEHFKELVSAVENLTARVTESHELAVPEGLINAAIDRLVVKGRLESLVIRLGEGVLRIDVDLYTSWARLGVTGDFSLVDILIEQRRQQISLRQSGKLHVTTSKYSTDWHRYLLMLLSPFLGTLAEFAFRRALRDIEGVRIAADEYHFDLAPHISKDSWLMKTISTLNITGARFEPEKLVLRGNLNVMGAWSLKD
ncbi:MAG: hypothetical protein VW625_05725 [Perlucidibaca sp.]